MQRFRSTDAPVKNSDIIFAERRRASSRSNICGKFAGRFGYVGASSGASVLQQTADRKAVEDLFGKYGRIVDVSVKRTVSGTPFAFVEFGDPRDAQDAIRGILIAST